MINNLIVYKFLKTLLTTERRQQGGSLYQDSFIHILKSSASMYESSCSHFFRNTTGIQSGPDIFDESGFVMTFVNIWDLHKYYAVSD